MKVTFIFEIIILKKNINATKGGTSRRRDFNQTSKKYFSLYMPRGLRVPSRKLQVVCMKY